MRTVRIFTFALMVMFIAGLSACWDPVGDKEDEIRHEQEAKSIGKTLAKTIVSMSDDVAEGLASDEEDSAEATAKLARIVAEGIVFNNGVFSGTLENPDGGSVTVEGSGAQNADGTYQFEATLVFEAFAVGDLAFTGSIDVEFTGSLELFTLTISGDVSVSGDIENEAEVDLTVSATADGVVVTGHVNGQEISENLN